MYDFTKIAIIKENGDTDIIFSCKENSLDNFMTFKKDDDIIKIHSYQESIKNNIYDGPKKLERHLYYIKDYLKDHFVEEFEKIKVNPQKFNDDKYLYYFLSKLNNIVLINSGVYHNILIVPSIGMNTEQLNSLSKLKKIYPDDMTWSIHDNMHLITIEDNGVKYADLDVGEPYKDSLDEYINSYEVKENKEL